MTIPSTNRTHALEQAGIAILLAGVIAVAALLAFILGFQAVYAGKIYPGIRIAGVDVGGLKPEEAADLLSANLAYFHSGRILLQDENTQEVWLVTPLQMGVFLDANGSARQAFDVGRSGKLYDRLNAQFDAWYYGSEFAPVLIFDQRLAQQYLSGLAVTIDRPIIEADLSVQGTEVIVRSGQPGRTLDISATIDRLTNQVV
ncbi:MAG TPA: peptidoglycan binding domain-containing protein, partial [Anaerolineaceae bacterium]|nr:peptidoglycan binding domain-containing protein [Anaerolineaceae bacterium]